MTTRDAGTWPGTFEFLRRGVGWYRTLLPQVVAAGVVLELASLGVDRALPDRHGLAAAGLSAMRYAMRFTCSGLLVAWCAWLVARASDRPVGNDRLVPAALVAVITGACIGVGFIAGVIPGILLSITWAVAPAVAGSQRVPARQALRWSSGLVAGRWGKVFLFGLVSGVLTSLPAVAVLLATGRHHHYDIDRLPIGSALAWVAVSGIATPVAALATVALYAWLDRDSGLRPSASAPAAAGPVD